jgi:cytochrome c biogenesis protein ResB
MLLLGLLLFAGSAAIGGALVMQNADAIAHVQAFGHSWTVHLYTVFIVGALLACWCLLGAALFSCRMAERRRYARARRAHAHAKQLHDRHLSAEATVTGRHSAPVRTHRSHIDYGTHVSEMPRPAAGWQHQERRASAGHLG